jgi:hypothetical protein
MLIHWLRLAKVPFVTQSSAASRQSRACSSEKSPSATVSRSHSVKSRHSLVSAGRMRRFAAFGPTHAPSLSHRTTFQRRKSNTVPKNQGVHRISKAIIDPVRRQLQAYVSFEPRIPLCDIPPENRFIQHMRLGPESEIWRADSELGLLVAKPLEVTPNKTFTG